MSKDKRVLVIGSGGREYAFAWKLFNDDEVSKVFCVPGNGGTESFARNIDIDITDFPAILDLIKKEKIDLTLIGPEGPLTEGIVDFLDKNDIRVFGPDKYASKLEGSKIFAREIMDEYNIPQPRYEKCSSADEVRDVKKQWGLPLVIKADGLAAGKGVIICDTDTLFEDAIEMMFDNKQFGEASNNVSVEECLYGEELSVFAVCDGENYRILNTAQDHKRAYDNDRGPNTGGMGAYSPTPLSTEELLSKTEERIIQPILNAMTSKGHPFVGFLYVGIMVVKGNPYVIEFNVRMGDPETQVVVPLLKSSLYTLMDDCIEGALSDSNIEVSDEVAVTVVLAAKGYPHQYSKGMKIRGLEKINKRSISHAGTRLESGEFVTSGGRVISVTGFGDSLNDAIDATYKMVDKITFEGKFYRKDIGQKGLSYK